MKRKLNSDDVPEGVAPAAQAESDTGAFAALGLDTRILKAVQKQQFAAPTAVQNQVIPLALQGKDVLARSGTGSGKTAAYVLPILHALLKRKATAKSSSNTNGPSTLILVPTRELAAQVTKVTVAFAAGCDREIRVENLARKEDDKIQKVRLANLPDIVISTPSRICANVAQASLSLESVERLVIDEADLIFSYGYKDDLATIAENIAKGTQVFLMSATLDTDVTELQGLLAKEPVVVDLTEAEKSSEGVSQYVVKCAEDEKFLVIYVTFKLKLITGKCIVFVDNIDRCYRLKLFLEQFGVRSCVLNSELPVNSRIHVVEEFNRNVYDIIIATDEHEVLGNERNSRKSDIADVEADDDTQADNAEAIEPPKKKSKGPKKDKEYGVSRGIDFRNVACVINFDLPTTSKSYTHRIGRTARAGQAGMALSFVIPREQYRKHRPTSIASTEHDEEVLEKITRHQAKKGHEIQPYQFDRKHLDPFRYRLADALRAVTRTAIREARIRELRRELEKSEKLKRHFEENPTDLQHLRHDSELKAARTQQHLKHVPDYLLPTGARKALTESQIGFVGLRKDRQRSSRHVKGSAKLREKRARRKADPLKSFSAKKR